MGTEERQEEAVPALLDEKGLERLISRYRQRHRELANLKRIDAYIEEGKNLSVSLEVYDDDGRTIKEETLSIPATDDIGRLIVNSLMSRVRTHAKKIGAVLGPGAIDLDALLEETE